MAVLATETWTGANGAAWPSQWAVPSGSFGTGTINIQTNRGRIAPSADYDSVGRYLNIAAASNLEYVVTYRISSNVETFGVFGIRTGTAGDPTGSGYPQTGYYAQLYTDGTYAAWQLSRNGQVIISEAFPDWAPVANTDYKIRVSAIGSNIAAKLWLGSVAEPAGWDFEWTDSSPLAAGQIWLGAQAGVATKNYEFDDLTVTDGSTTATHQGAGSGSGNTNAVGDGTLVAGPVQGAGVGSANTDATGAGTIDALNNSVVASTAANATAAGHAVIGSAGAASTAINATGAGTAWVTNNSGEASANFNAIASGEFFKPRDIVLYTKLTGTFVDPAGNPIEGWIILTPGIPYQLDHLNHRIVILKERRIPLVGGTFAAMVAGNGTPEGAIWRWTCELVRNGQPRRGAVDFVVPIGVPEIDLADCTVR